MPPGTKKTSISLDPELEERAKKRAAEKGFQYSFSAYVAALIRDDLSQIPPPTPTGEPVNYRRRSKLPPGKRGIAKEKEN
jgi:hypothetical protein